MKRLAQKGAGVHVSKRMWRVWMRASYCPVVAYVEVEASNMAEAKKLALQHTEDCDWEVREAPDKGSVRISDAESIP